MSELKLLQWTYSLSILIIAITQSFIPKFSGKGVYLGVRFSKDNSERDEIKQITKKYIRLTIGLGIVLAILIYFLVANFQENYGLQTIFILFATALLILPIIWGNRKLKEFKEEWNDSGPKKIITVSTEVSGKKIGLSDSGLWLYIIPFFIIVLGSAYTLSNYHSLPDMIPTHFNFQGEADAFSEKSIITTLLPSLINLILFITVFISNLVYLSAKQRLNPDDPQGSLERYLLARKIWTIFYAILTILFVGFIQVSVTSLTFGNTGYANLTTWIILGITAVISIVSIILGVKVGTVGEKLPGSGISSYDSSDTNWKFAGLLYYNKKDPATFVYKRVGVGVTINLATPFGKIMIGLLILTLVLPIYFLI